MGKAVGIDLGTTYSAVATIDDSGNSVVLNNAEGQSITPSVVFFSETDGEDEPLVGDMAKNMAGSAPDNVVQFVKRQMGNPSWSFESPSGQSYSAEEISAIILKRLKRDAEAALGEPVTDAVITVPAYFDDARRTATKQAGKIAGFNVMRVLNEPTAAALSYGIGMNNEINGNVLVYDLGGGTFDVTVLNVNNNVLDVLATDGDRNLGGFDFDNAIMNLVAEEVSKQGGNGLLDDYQATAALREQAEMAKRALTTTEKTNVFVSFRGRPYKVALTRKQFEKATESLLGRTEDLVKDVMDEAHLQWNQIDYLLLIGGSSRMPMVRKMIEKLTGKVPQNDANPDEDVARGAAYQALLEVAGGNASSEVAPTDVPYVPGTTDVVVQDVASQPLGVVVWDSETNMERNAVIIPRNSHIPGSYSDVFRTVSDNQTELHVEVTQGDDPDPQFVIKIGESTLRIPPYPANSPVRITYHYDIDQTVQIEVTDLVTNQSLGMFEIDRSANMDESQVNAAADRLAQMEID